MRRFLELSIMLLLVLPFSVATSPAPEPYHSYGVNGYLERPSGGSRANFAVSLLGWYHNQADTGFLPLPRVSNPETADIPVALTDSTGAFYLLVNSAVEADSFKFSVSLPGHPTILGEAFGQSDLVKSAAHFESYQLDSQPGCYGCTTDPETTERVAFYAHLISRHVSVPF